MVTAALFSGGKESVYSLLMCRRLGIDVDLLLILHPTLAQPSPHIANIELLRRSAELIGIEWSEVRLKRGEAERSLVRSLEKLGVRCLVAGDIFVEEHRRWYESICSHLYIDLLEPLWGADTSSLLVEYLKAGMRIKVIGIRRGKLPLDFLGTIIGKREVEELIGVHGVMKIDPCGENGEYHTLVLNSPLHEDELEPKRKFLIEKDQMIYEQYEI